MIQPVKKLRILSLTVKGFKGFSEETAFTFGVMNTITGHNGQGKSSIADAIAFAITGVSFYGGSRLDHLYHKNTRDISVTLVFADESGASHRLSRSRVNDNMDIFLDERRMTQRDLTIMFGERDLFLSMLNPRYFIDILGAKGRDLLERYLPDIPKETILAGLSEHNQALLEGQDFLSAEAFAQKLREEIAQLKRDAIYTQGQYDLQVSQAEENAAQLEQKQAQHDSLTAEAAELEARRTTGFDGTSLREKLPDLYARHEELLREQPAGPELTAEVDAQIQAAAQTLEQLRAKTYQSKYTQALADTQARIDTLKKEVSRQKYIVAGLKPGVQCPMCKQTVTEATLPKVKQEFQTSVDSLSRLQMNRVAISLYEVAKTTGEIRDVFKFTYEDRPYVCLSGSERIRAGLEVAELVKGLVGVDFPVFIDDAERVPVIDNVRPSGQIFIAKVAKDVKLTVQTASAAPPAQAA